MKKRITKEDIIDIIFVVMIMILITDIINFNREYGNIVDMYNSVANQYPLSAKPATLDTFSLMRNFCMGGATKIVVYLFPLILAALTIYNDDEKLYRKTIKKAYKNILIVPIFFGLLFVAAMIGSHFNFNPVSSFYIYSPALGVTLLDQVKSTIFVLINILLVSVSIVNMSLYFKKLFNDKSICLFITCLVLVAYQFFIDIAISPLVVNLKLVKYELTWANLWNYSSIGMYIYLIIIIYISSLLMNNVQKKH